jgi:hypothetical protein
MDAPCVILVRLRPKSGQMFVCWAVGHVAATPPQQGARRNDEPNPVSVWSRTDFTAGIIHVRRLEGSSDALHRI